VIDNINKRFIEMRNDFDEKNILIYTVAYNIAPTIFNKKPSTILNFTREGRDLYRLWELYRQDFLNKFPIETYEIKKTRNNVLILFYNPNELENTLNNHENLRLLKDYGYSEAANLEECLYTLKKRFRKICPHEVGVFLGIPAEDVRGFINNLGRDYLINGYWKVYNDFKGANKIFSLYDDAKLRVLQLMSSCKN
jgi:hypothetical protein